ncbi:MAG: InlB B-repeat-containing protein [Anaeroplasmataceae bacterium]|nr:InlB B-repeat-containing protein [Anaeroplasmataceae bacterium]
MKKWLSLFLVFLLFVLPGCQVEIETPILPFYTVQFDSDGGTEIESQRIEEGQKAIRPQDPTKDDSVFEDWYLFNEPYDFSSSITEDIILTAHWESNFENYGMDVIEITLSDISITESGFYTSMEEVGAYIFTYHKLPDNFCTKNKFNRFDYTKENKLSVGGDVFYNREGLLPYKQGRTYTECDIDYTGTTRNAKRIVFSSDFLIFYTSDHYSSFSILRFL